MHFCESDTYKGLVMLSNKQRLKDQYAGYILPPNVAGCTISQTEFFTKAKVLWASTKRP